MNLGELIVELCADTAQLEKSLEQAKKKAYEAASSIEKSFEKINLEINVDDDSLIDLNKHLNLKVQHLKEVNKYFSNNPIVVNVDDDSLTDLNKHLNLKVQHLKEVNKYFNNNPIVVNTDVTKLDELEERLGKLSNKTITITVESDLSKQLEKSLTDAVQSAVRDAVSESSVASSQQQAQKDSASSSKAQRVDVIASPMRSIIDGAFENVGKRLTKGINSSIEDTIGVSMDDMTRMSGNMLLRYFGVGKKAQSDPKNEQKRIEAIFKDGMDAFIRTHDSRVEKGIRGRKITRSAANDDISIDFESASRIASSSALRYFGIGKKAQSDPKNEQARVKAIIEDAIKEYSGSSIKQNNSGVISSTFSEINKAFSDSINVTIESIAQNTKLATIRQARQSAKAVTQNSAPGIQNAISGFFDAAESGDKGAVNKYIGEGIASQSKKAVESIFNKLLPNASPIIKDFLKAGVSVKPVEPVVKSSSDILKEAALDLKNAAKALSDAAINVKSTEPTAKTSKPFAAETIPDPWQDATPLPKQLPPKANKSPLPPPQQKRELEPIPVNIPEQIKPLFKTIQSEIHKNIDISEGYKNATKSENDLTPLPSIPSSKNTKKYTQVSLDSIEQSLIAINKYFSDEYKRIQAKVKHAVSDAGTKEDISAARSEVSNFVSRSKEAISTIDRYVKTGQDAGFSKDINSELSKIHSSGKSSISRNTSTAEKSLGKLNLADKKLFDQQLKGYIAQAESLGIEVDAGLKKGIQHAAGGVSDAARAMLDDLIKTVKAKMEIQSPSEVMIRIGQHIVKGLIIGITNLAPLLSKTVDAFKYQFDKVLAFAHLSLPQKLKSNVDSLIFDYQLYKPEITKNVATSASVINDSLGNTFKGIPGNVGGLKDIGVNFIKSFAQGVLGADDSVFNVLGSFAKLAINTIKKVFGIASPSKVMESIGLDFGKGFENGTVASLILANKRIAALILKTVNESSAATESQKTQAEKFANIIESQNQKIAKGFREGKYSDLDASEVIKSLAGGLRTGKHILKNVGASEAEVPSILQQAKREVNSLPKAYTDILKAVSHITGVTINSKNAPKLIPSTFASSGITGSYSSSTNTIKVAEEAFNELTNRKLSELSDDLVSTIVHELFHGVQSGFGKVSNEIASEIQANASLSEVAKLSPYIENSVSSVRKKVEQGKLDPKYINIFRGLETGAYVFENRYASIIKNESDLKKIPKLDNLSSGNTPVQIKQALLDFGKTYKDLWQGGSSIIKKLEKSGIDTTESREIIKSITKYKDELIELADKLDKMDHLSAQHIDQSVRQIKDIEAKLDAVKLKFKSDAKDKLDRYRNLGSTQKSQPSKVMEAVSPIITPRSFAPNPDAQLVLSSSVNSNPNARLVLPNSNTLNPDARLVLPNSNTLNPNARLVLPNSVTPNPDARLILPSRPSPVSPIITPRSFAPNPDARLVLPNSNTLNPDARLILPSRPRPVSPIITPRSFAPNPDARLVLPNSTTVNPNARLVLPNSAIANPDAQLILPSRPGTTARTTITQQEVNTQALINKNKDLLVNLNALLTRNMTASLTGFATVLDDLMNAPRSPVVRSLTRQVGARLPVVLPPTVPTSLVPEPFKSTTIKPSLPTGLGFFPIPASSAKPPAVAPSPFAPTSPPPPPIPPAPPSLSSPPPPPADGFLPIRVRTPQNATNQYLQLGKDLVTNLFTAVGDSIRQSTLSGYASLGQVMRNAVNAALFSLADTLKQPLYKGLLSQAQSALPWFMKFIPKTMQLIPMLKPLMPIIGGLTLGLGNSIVKNLLNNDVLKPGGFLTKLLSSVTRIDLTSLSGGKAHGVLGAIFQAMNPVPNVINSAGIGRPLSLAMGLFGPFMNTFSGLLGLDPSTRFNPKNQAPTVEKVLQEQTLANRKKAGLSNAKGGQASRELIENLGNTAVDSVLENLSIPMIPTSIIQGMTGRGINKQSGKIADVISSIGVQRSKTEKALERAMKSGTISPERLDALTKAALRRRGVDTTTREAMSREELEKVRQDIIGKPLAISENERNLMFAMGDIERSRFKLGVPRAQRRLDYLTAKVLKERGVTFSDYTSMKQSGKLEETRRDLAANPNTTGVVGRLTQAYATNDQEALKGLLMQGLRKTGMSSEQLQNIDPKLLNTATAGLMATLTGLQAKFKEKGFDMGKALAQGFKDSVRNLANAKDDLEYNAKKAIGQANFGDAVGLIFRRMTRGTVATQDQFKEMYNQMGAGVKKALFSNPKEANEMFPNMLQFMGSLATTLAPVTSLFASLSPLFLPLAPIIGGIGAAVSMVAPHVAKLIDGIQRVEVLQRRFTFLGGSKAGGEAEFKYAKDVAVKMNVPSEVAANSYSQLAIAAKDSKMEGQGVKDLFEGITASLSALGITGQDASLVFMAYTQILAKGKLSMEELRQQLGEKFPPAMGVFAKAMGASVPEMNALVQSGGVLSQDILPKVAKVLNQDYGASAANQAGGLVVALNKLGNVGFEITTIFTDKLGGTLGWFIGTFADGLALFSNTLGALIPLGQSFAIGFAATIAIGLTTIMTKVKPLVVLFGSLQNLLMETFTAVATNMMPMIIGVTADVADNWLGAEKDLITNMMDGITNAVVATFSTVDSVMRSMSGGNFSFSSMFGGLVQGAEQAGNIIDWLKGVFSGFFKIIPPGFVELLAIVFMFEQGTGLMVMALAPAFKGFMGAVTGMFGGAAKAFMGVMTSMKIASELMMTSMNSAMAASEARIKIFSATMGFLRTALTHVAVAFGILMFSKGDFSNPMGDSLSKTTKELNNGLTEIRANVQKTADSFDKAANSVTKLGGALADTLPSKGIQLDIRSFWGGGDFKWDDAIKERNRRNSASGSLMDVVGVGALGAAGAGAGFAASFGGVGVITTAVLGLISPVVGAFAPVVLALAGLAAAVTAAVVALDLFAPKLTEKQKQLIADNKLEGYFDLGENARLTNAQQQILKYFEDQKKNIQNLKEFGASQGFTGKPGDFMADIKPLTSEQQNTFNNTPAISKLNQEIKDNNDRRLAAIADKKNSGASPQEIKDLQNSPGFKELENKSKQMRNAVALATASFQIENTPENQRIDKELDEKIKKKQAEIDKRRAAVSTSRNLMAASSTDAFALSIGESSDAGTIKLENELKVLEAQKKNQQKLIRASVQRAFDFKEIKKVDKQLVDATKKGVELSKALPSDKVRKEQGEVKQLIQQLYKRRQELVDSFGSPLPILENQLKKLEKYKEQLTLGEVQDIQGALIPPAVQATQRQIEELKNQIAGVKPFDVKPVEEMLYTQATNAVKDANIKFERVSSANRIKSNLSQSQVYSSAGTSQQIAPELANIQLAGLNDSRTLLEEKLKTNQIALDKIAQVIAVGGTNLAEAQSEYDKLTEDIMKDRESLTQNALETAKARRDMKQALIDQTKQVAEYYRTSVREAQGASIEFEKAKKTLEGSQLQNKLRAALIGAGDNIYTQFIEGIINIISQTTEMEKKRLDEKKQQYDYQNNVDDIKLRASELQRSLPGKIVPFDENKIKDFDEQLKIVQGSVVGINTDVQQVVTSLGQDAVLATNQLNDAFQGLGTTVAEVGTKLDTTLDKLTSTLDSLKVGTNDLSPQNAPNWAAGALDILGQMDNATPGTAPTIPATTPTIPSAPSPATNFASPVKNTTIQDLINYKPTFGQSVMGSRPKGRIHNKVDFDSRAKAGAGAEILASLPGVATGKLWEGNDGAVFVNSVLPSGTKITIEYGHLSVESIKKALGGVLEKSVQVQAGQKLGNVLGDHLDFGVKANGRYINPQVFLSNLARGNYGAIANQPPVTSKAKTSTTGVITGKAVQSSNKAFDAKNIVSKNNLQSLLVQELNTGRLLASVKSNVSPVSSASTVKLIIADLLTDAINQGQIGLQEVLTIKPGEVAQWSAINKADQKRKISELITQMIVKSDNTASNVLINSLGGLGRLNQLAAAKGYSNTKFNKYFMLPGEDDKKGNVSTASDVNAAARDILTTNSPSDRLASQALKTTRNFKYTGEVGGKIGNNSKIIGNVGVVDINGKLYLVTAFANANGNDVSNRKIITNATNDIVKAIQNTNSATFKNVTKTKKPLNTTPSIPGTSRITQGGNDLSAEEYAKLTPLGKKLYELRRNPNVLALANAVARAEGTDFRKNSENFGYGMLIGGANVKDFSTHPFVGTGRKPIWIPGINNSSTASGRYQMMNFNASIQAAKKQFGKDAMPDMFKLIDFQGKDQPGFSPGLQDLYFIGSLLQRGVLDDVVAGKIDSSVLNKLAPHYASIGLGNKRSAYSGQGTPQGKHDNFLKFYQQNLGKLNQIVMTGGAVNPDKLQGLVTEAANLNLGATATRNSTNEMNNEAQRLTDEVQQLLGIYRLLRQTEEAGFSALSGMKDLNLDFVKTIAEGLSPSGLSSLEKFNIAYGELVRSLEKKRESLEKTIRDTQGTVDNKPLLKAAFESALQKFPTAELALKAIKANDKVFEIAVLQNQQAKKMLSDYDASIPKILDAFKGKFSFDEQLRLSGIAIQNEKSRVALLQKQIEQRKLLQQLDPLDAKSARTAELEANIALLNADLDLREKLNNVSRQENTKEISLEDAKKQRNLAQEEYAINKQNVYLKLEIEKITERTNNANKLLERAQYLQDSIKSVSDSRSSLLKSYGLDFSAEKLDKQSAIDSQQMEFDKASIQLEDFIEKNKLATEVNRLTNEQINELRENLRLTNEYKLDAIKLQFSELASVIKNTTSGFRNGFKEFLLSTKSFGESLADLFNSITKNLIDSLADIASKRMTDSLFGWVAGLFGGKGAGLASGGSFIGDVLPNTSFNMAFAGGMVGELPTFANGGIVGALNKERSLTGRVPHVIVASEGERVLNHKETAIWNKLQGGITGFASGGVVGTGGNGTIASRIGNTTTINVPVSVAVGSDSEVDTRRLSQAVQAMVSDGIRREMRVGGSINRGNPYGR